MKKEIDDLTRKHEKTAFELAKVKQQAVIRKCERNVEMLEKEITDIKKEIKNISEFISEQRQIKKDIDSDVSTKMKGLKIFISIVCLILAGAAAYIGINYSEILGVVTAIIPILLFITTLWTREEIKIFSLMSKVRKMLFTRQANLRRYSAEKVEHAVYQKEDAEERLAHTGEELSAARKELHQESAKLDRFSAGISS